MELFKNAFFSCYVGEICLTCVAACKILCRYHFNDISSFGRNEVLMRFGCNL